MDYLTSFIIWSLAVYGTALIVTAAKIFDKPRTWISSKSKFIGEMLKCILCTSFWCGLAWGFYWNPFTNINNIFTPLFNGVLGAATTWLIYLNAPREVK